MKVRVRFSLLLLKSTALFLCVMVATVAHSQIYSCYVSAPGECLTSLSTNEERSTIDLFFVCSPVEKDLVLSMPDTNLSVQAGRVTVIIIQKDTLTNQFRLRQTVLPKANFPARNASWCESGISILTGVDQKGKRPPNQQMNFDGVFDLFMVDTARLSVQKRSEVELRCKKSTASPGSNWFFCFSTIASGESFGVMTTDSIFRINNIIYTVPSGKWLRNRFSIHKNGNVAWSYSDTLESIEPNWIPEVYAWEVSEQGETALVSKATRSLRFGNSTLDSHPAFYKNSPGRFYYVLNYDSLGKESWGSTILSETSMINYINLAFDDSGALYLSGAFDGTLTFNSMQSKQVVKDNIVSSDVRLLYRKTQLFVARLTKNNSSTVFLTDTATLFIIPVLTLVGLGSDSEPGLIREVDSSHQAIGHPMWVTKLSTLDGKLKVNYVFPGKIISDTQVEKMGRKTLVRLLVKEKKEYTFEWYWIQV